MLAHCVQLSHVWTVLFVTQVLSVFRGFHTEGVSQVCFSPDGQVSRTYFLSIV